MKTLRERLQAHEQAHGPIRVGLVGTGQMGTGLISQMEKMDGIAVMAAADILPGRAMAAFAESDVAPDLVVALDEDVDVAAEALANGRRVATTSADFLVQIPNLDVIVESTGVPEVGARVCSAAIEAGRHVVNMNVEADATIGYYLATRATEQGVVYSLAAGDEPGAIKELFDFADALGFEVIMVGKGKNNPLNRASNPTSAAEKAARQQMSPKMLASFEDGTKTMVEMTSIGNALGFPPEKRGAHGPDVTVDTLADVFQPKEDGGILENKYIVDYAVGDVAPGVFIIITTDQEKIIRDLNYVRLNGNGKYWALYRPYHLCNLETPITVANVALDKRPTLLTERIPVAETIAIAKKDLQPGEVIDSLGGFCAYGMIEKRSVAEAENIVPLGLVVGATVVNPIQKGEAIRYSDVELDESQLIVSLRRKQDELIRRATLAPA